MRSERPCYLKTSHYPQFESACQYRDDQQRLARAAEHISDTLGARPGSAYVREGPDPCLRFDRWAYWLGDDDLALLRIGSQDAGAMAMAAVFVRAYRVTEREKPPPPKR